MTVVIRSRFSSSGIGCSCNFSEDLVSWKAGNSWRRCSIDTVDVSQIWQMGGGTDSCEKVLMGEFWVANSNSSYDDFFASVKWDRIFYSNIIFLWEEGLVGNWKLESCRDVLEWCKKKFLISVCIRVLVRGKGIDPSFSKLCTTSFLTIFTRLGINEKQIMTFSFYR